MGYFLNRQVNLGCKVPYSTLKNAIEHAAEDIGWTARDKDIVDTSYELGSVKKILKLTDRKTITLKGLIFNKLDISAHSGRNSSILISNPFPVPASEKKTEKFLDLVSKYLPSA